MAKYIDADALKKELHLLCDKYNVSFGGESKGFGAELATIADKLPAADVRPERHGQWIEDGDYQICSECGEEHAWEDFRASYCDVCGAKMDGKESKDNG